MLCMKTSTEVQSNMIDLYRLSGTLLSQDNVQVYSVTSKSIVSPGPYLRQSLAQPEQLVRAPQQSAAVRTARQACMSGPADAASSWTSDAGQPSSPRPA